ncbi:MAG: NAD(P)H-hydrate epimerase [Planctomycetes bacterium]|nr:NAD(P)H-hydrate epimerase [Planctomycetota bacterium]
MEEIFSLTKDQSRQIDKIAMDEYGIKGVMLMENAGRASAAEAADMLGDTRDADVTIFCGKGNNGGDGFVVARHLSNWGCSVNIYLSGKINSILREAGDTAVNLEIALNMNLPITEIENKGDVQKSLDDAREGKLIVDALLGTGISGEVRGLYKPLIEGINSLPVPVLAIDVPSGLDCDTGKPLGVAVQAERTVTFVTKKQGYNRPEAGEYIGQLKVIDIGVPRRMLEQRAQEWGAKKE